MSFASDDRRPRILVAEDNYLMAQEVGDFVLGCGYTLAGAAASVEGGLALIANSPLDGAVLDIDLAGEPSFPMCEALDAKGVPFVFLSAYSSASTLVPLKFRTAPHIDKPFEPSLRAVAAQVRARSHGPCSGGRDRGADVRQCRAGSAG